MASKNVTIVIRATERFTSLVIRKLGADIVANLRRAPSEGGTPVDTGWARANWIMEIGRPATGTVGSRKEVTAAPQEASIARAITQYTTKQGPLYITNNVPYIRFLNEGSSKQAPAGFVQKNIFEAIRMLKTI